MTVNKELTRLEDYSSILQEQLNEVNKLIELSKKGKYNKEMSKRIRFRSFGMQKDGVSFRRHLKAIENSSRCTDKRANNKITVRPKREQKNGKLN